MFEKCSELMARIQDVPVPVIAEVKGNIVGHLLFMLLCVVVKVLHTV